MEMIVDYKDKKVYDHLKLRPYGKVLFIFDHGLGDLINFFPLYESMKNLFPNCTFKIGVPEKRKYTQELHPSIISLDNSFRSKMYLYQHIFRIHYKEPSIEERFEGIKKPYLCNSLEIGIPNLIWKPFKHSDFVINSNDSVHIGVHFTGSTNPRFKNINFSIMERIWKEIEECGCIPFDVHMDCYTTLDKNFPKFINKSNSLRFKKINMELLIYAIKQCKFFFGIDSGPFYLATSILGVNKCIFLKNKMDINWYFPNPVKIIDTLNYNNGTVTKLLETLEI
jgi:hypothetical protein